MSSDSAGTPVTAVQLVVSTVPTDDAGARTADLFDWQASMAAADGLALYRSALNEAKELVDDDNCRLICEHHEDWVAVRASDAELVSAKHKEPAFGAFTTYNQLLGDGGLAHLFLRWRMLKEQPTCRLATNVGLAAGAAQNLAKATVVLRAQRLAGTSLASSDGSVTGFARALLGRSDMPHEWQQGEPRDISIPTAEQSAEVARFLSMLSLPDPSPSRLYVSYAAPAMYAKPILDRLGRPDIQAESVWEAVLALFRARMRAAGPKPEGGLPAVLAYPLGAPAPSLADMERSLASRIVTLGDIDIAVRTAIANPGGYMPLTRILRTSPLAVKMAAGRCTDNSIERAEHLKLDYQNYWRNRGSGDPAARLDKERLVRVLLRIGDQASESLSHVPEPIGNALWKELQLLINGLNLDDMHPGMDHDLLLGGVCDLVNRCKIWFSPAFEVQVEIDRLRALQESAS
ncbi:hypothetical protein ACFWYW_12235 [Nonomuraea sp. NPDC059023]|uniref:hypothetical protein n=1 Tax=unclassified Nonomuraea TaxID=2593643 RepID=UPI0036CA8395